MNSFSFNAAAINAREVVPGAAPLRFRAALVAALKADAGVAATVGAKVFPGRVPENVALPAIIWQVVSLPRDHHLGGTAGVARARVQFSAIAKTAADCEVAAESLRQLLDGFTGRLPGGVVVLETNLLDERDMSDAPDDGSDAGVFRTSQDYFFLFREPPAR